MRLYTGCTSTADDGAAASDTTEAFVASSLSYTIFAGVTSFVPVFISHSLNRSDWEVLNFCVKVRGTYLTILHFLSYFYTVICYAEYKEC